MTSRQAINTAVMCRRHPSRVCSVLRVIAELGEQRSASCRVQPCASRSRQLVLAIRPTRSTATAGARNTAADGSTGPHRHRLGQLDAGPLRTSINFQSVAFSCAPGRPVAGAGRIPTYFSSISACCPAARQAGIPELLATVGASVRRTPPPAGRRSTPAGSRCSRRWLP